MTGIRDKLVNLLRSKAGVHEGRDPNGNWNNVQQFSPETPGLEWSQGQPWCATFEAWAAHRVGADALWPMTASCYTAVQWWKDRGRFTEYPVLGAPFYMGSAGQDHTGVVYAYDADSIWTVEGNTNVTGSYQGDGVYLRVRPRRGAGSPYGYGVPNFPEGTISADPRLGGIASAKVAPPAAPPQVRVSLSHIVAAAHADPKARQGATTYPADVNVVEAALAAEGLLSSAYSHDGSFGTKTVTAYAALQHRYGYVGAAADGIPGRTSLTKLGAAHGFVVID
ncbi:hypothetical protein [Streptomyces sp. RKAG337]|uniref:hypothetical protein n=1 Tax=Streptomyces sp. RKAG337 TaxID=2893404 RepID=UPI002033ECB0|nr:hypothetical protein [Streptomyces sp. RKAG337]MCM2427394.1 hypothetical protein [Streptomyces sp. RKAG337]